MGCDGRVAPRSFLNNDTGAARYNKAAADLAWSRTLAFFAENLGVPPKGA